VTGPVVITLDQLRRPHPGGIGNYARGLVAGLVELGALGEFSEGIAGLAPRSSQRPDPLDTLGIDVVTVPFGVRLATRVWRFVPTGVSGDAGVVHATSLAGPFAGGRRDALHTVAVQDLLWRDHPDLTTSAGARFHERRLSHIRSRHDVRVIVTSHQVRERLVRDGFGSERVFVVRLGVDRTNETADASAALARLGVSLAEPFGYTLSVGTVQPRKNLTRLVAAHAEARRAAPELGPLLIAGAKGWGDVDTGDATLLGSVDHRDLAGLIAGCRALAYVPIAEGWGLPPVEALVAGRPVLSSPVPSIEGNAEVRVVDPLNTDSIVAGLVDIAGAVDGEAARERRRDSVAQLTWTNCARDHLEAWR